MFSAAVHDHIYHHATAAAGATARAIHSVGLDQPPLTARAPVAIKLVERIFGMLVGMLLPLRIVHPDAVSHFVILLLQGVKEVADDALFRPIAVKPDHSEDNHYERDCRDDSHPA